MCCLRDLFSNFSVTSLQRSMKNTSISGVKFSCKSKLRVFGSLKYLHENSILSIQFTVLHQSFQVRDAEGAHRLEAERRQPQEGH